MANINIDFTNPEDYSFDEDKIEVNNSCKLKNLSTETTQYSQDNPEIKFVMPIPSRYIQSVNFNIVTQNDDEVRVVINSNGKYLYHNGIDWAKSAGYAQSNTPAEISANIESIIDTLSLINITSFLHSHDGTSTPEIKSIEIKSALISTQNETRNSFCGIDKARSIISAYCKDSEVFMSEDELTQEKTLINAYEILTRFIYSVDLSRFDTLSEETQNLFIRAQCEQCICLLSPDSAADLMRKQGITGITKSGESLTILNDEKFFICDEARQFIQHFIDDTVFVY